MVSRHSFSKTPTKKARGARTEKEIIRAVARIRAREHVRWRGLAAGLPRTRCFQVVEQKRYGRACGFGLFSRCLPSLLQCLVKLHGDGKASGVGETLVLTIVSVWASCGLLRRSGRLLLPARAGLTSLA